MLSVAMGPFNTDLAMLVDNDHARVEGTPHIYEPDIWPGGRYHNEWVGRGGLEVGRQEIRKGDLMGLGQNTKQR